MPACPASSCPGTPPRSTGPWPARRWRRAVATTALRSATPGYLRLHEGRHHGWGRGHPAASADVERAEADARKAIAADPKAPLPRVFLAATLGYEARIIGTVQAKLKGYAGEAKDNLDAALKSDPNNPWALAAMGGWNIGVVNGGGSWLASMMYGATVKEGLSYYAKAMAADPVGIPIRFQYVLSLSAYDRDSYAKEIGAALKFAATGKPRTAYEEVMQGQARRLLELFQRGDWKHYDTMVKKYQGYPD